MVAILTGGNPEKIRVEKLAVYLQVRSVRFVGAVGLSARGSVLAGTDMPGVIAVTALEFEDAFASFAFAAWTAAYTVL